MLPGRGGGLGRRRALWVPVLLELIAISDMTFRLSGFPLLPEHTPLEWLLSCVSDGEESRCILRRLSPLCCSAGYEPFKGSKWCGSGMLSGS